MLPLPENLILDSGSQRLIDLTSRTPPQRSAQEIEEILTILQRKSPKLLDGLVDSNKVTIAKQCQLKMYPRDSIIFMQGDEPDAYYTVIRGAVSIYALNANLIKSDDGGENSSNNEDLAAMENSRDQYGVFLLQLPPGEVRFLIAVYFYSSIRPTDTLFCSV
jgi:hypothetical protein